MTKEEIAKERKYFYIVPNYYGYGKTLEEARKNVVKASGKQIPKEEGQSVVYYFDPEIFEDFGIDGMGIVGWKYREGVEGDHEPIRLPPQK